MIKYEYEIIVDERLIDIFNDYWNVCEKLIPLSHEIKKDLEENKDDVYISSTTSLIVKSKLMKEVQINLLKHAKVFHSYDVTPFCYLIGKYKTRKKDVYDYFYSLYVTSKEIQTQFIEKIKKKILGDINTFNTYQGIIDNDNFKLLLLIHKSICDFRNEHPICLGYFFLKEIQKINSNYDECILKDMLNDANIFIKNAIYEILIDIIIKMEKI